MNTTRRIRALGLAIVAATATAVTGLATAPAAQAADLGSTLTVGQGIPNGSYLSNGDYRLTMRTDGNLVLTKGSTAIWASNTSGTGSSSHALFGSGGELAVWNGSGDKLWHTLTYGEGTKVALLGDGDLDVYKGSAAIWGTHTYGGRNELENSKIYTKALSLVGKYDYVYGAGHGANPGPTNGELDCSGFVRYVYYLASGRDIMNGATDGQIRLANHQDDYGAPGSLIFYSETKPKSFDDKPPTHHVGVYGGNGWLINEWDSGHKTLVNHVGDSSGYQLEYYSRSW